MNKHTLSPAPLYVVPGRALPRRPASSGRFLRVVVPALLMQGAGLVLAMEFIPAVYGEAVSGLFGQVSDALAMALARH